MNSSSALSFSRKAAEEYARRSPAIKEDGPGTGDCTRGIAA